MYAQGQDEQLHEVWYDHIPGMGDMWMDEGPQRLKPRVLDLGLSEAARGIFNPAKELDTCLLRWNNDDADSPWSSSPAPR